MLRTWHPLLFPHFALRSLTFSLTGSNMQDEIALRAIATRLTITPVQDLPRVSGFLASSLAQCSLESHFTEKKSTGSASVAVHKLKTRVASLLQDRTVAGRLTAAALIKAIVDNGSSNVLSAAEVWARGLVTCLNKSDPVHVKKIYLAAIIRIFVLTQNHPTLLREITTPLLPPFLTACIGLIRPVKHQSGEQSTEVTSPLLDSVLQCWCQLLPQHATVFRPFLSRMRALGQRLLERSTSISIRKLASRLMCLLISCAPKNTISQEWTQTAVGIIGSAHQTADQLFRAVIEEYEPNDTSTQRVTGKHDFSEEPRTSAKDQLGLDGWNGIHQGSSRLLALIDWLGSLISVPLLHPVTVPTGRILDLISRIQGITPPGKTTNVGSGLRYHNEATREEKEQLWLNLPLIHASCLQLLQKLNETYGQSLLAVDDTMLSLMLENFEVISGDHSARRAIYEMFTAVTQTGSILNLKIDRSAFSTLVEHCCNDLKSSLLNVNETVNPTSSKDGFLNTNKPTSSPHFDRARVTSKVYQAAWDLLSALIAHVPSSMIPRQLRIEMDRITVLLGHKDAMLASVMRPMLSDKGKSTTASLIPFLARLDAEGLVTEALLRPRMPAVATEAVSVLQSQDEESSGERGSLIEGAQDDKQEYLEEEEEEEDETSYRTAQIAPDEGFPRKNMDTAEPKLRDHSPPTTSQKRPLDAIVEPGNSDHPAPPRDAKLPRLYPPFLEVHNPAPFPAGALPTSDNPSQNPIIPEVYLTIWNSYGKPTAMATATATATAISAERISSTTANVAANAESGNSKENGRGRQIANENESDSDDSEIPQIDPGFDTDEEEEEDE